MPGAARAWSSTEVCGGRGGLELNSMISGILEQMEKGMSFRGDSGSSRKEEENGRWSAGRCPHRRTRGGALIRAL
jgi:hypothetical protein